MSKLYQGAIKMTSGFEFNAQKPLDDRSVVATLADLNTLVAYEGLLVYVQEKRAFYVYRQTSDSDKTLAWFVVNDPAIVVALTTLQQTLSNNYYDKNGTEQAIADAIVNLSSASFQIVNNKSEMTKTNILYLYKEDATSGALDPYDIYAVINNAPVKIDSMDVNMSNYYTDVQVDDLIERNMDEVNQQIITVSNNFDGELNRVSDNIDTLEGDVETLEKELAKLTYEPTVITNVKIGSYPPGYYEKGTSITIQQSDKIVALSELGNWHVFDGSGEITDSHGDLLSSLDFEGIYIEDGEGSFATSSDLSTISENVMVTVYLTEKHPNIAGLEKNTAPKTVYYYFVIPFYKGTTASPYDPPAGAQVDITDGLDQITPLSGKKNITTTFSTGPNERPVFAYDTKYGALTKIIDQNGFDVTADWISVDNVIDGNNKYGVNQKFHMYFGPFAEATNFSYTFIF